jgi:hypothetical protein
VLINIIAALQLEFNHKPVAYKYLRCYAASLFYLAKARRRKEKNTVQTQNIASLQFRASVVKIEKNYVPMWFGRRI